MKHARQSNVPIVIDGYVLEELNVKSIVPCNDPLKYASLRDEPEFSVLGKRLGKSMPVVAKEVKAMSQEDILAFEKSGEITVAAHSLKLTDIKRTKDLDTPKLLEQLPALQQLLFRVLGCQPQGATVHNFVIQLALSMVASESIKIYNAISDGVVNLVDKRTKDLDTRELLEQLPALQQLLFRVLGCQRTKDLDTPELLEQLPALQPLLFRVLGCQPQGATVHNFVIQLALSMFFEMQRRDALKALDIYQRSGNSKTLPFSPQLDMSVNYSSFGLNLL